jgi:hypothetical protein
MLEKRHVYNPKKTQNFLIVVHDKSEKEIDWRKDIVMGTEWVIAPNPVTILI